ncbi:MAG: hypothetical protein KDD22_07125 [Bdellovibrionales bacterium]|nr:hypothetical protein [Bdellovibrionales bacterium]
MSSHRKQHYPSRTHRVKTSQIGRTRIEHFYYEIKPFLCILTAIYFIKTVELKSFGQISAILLLIAGTMILFERAKYRGFIK